MNTANTANTGTDAPAFNPAAVASAFGGDAQPSPQTSQAAPDDTSAITSAITGENINPNPHPHSDQPNEPADSSDADNARAKIIKEAAKLGLNKAKGDDSLAQCGRLVFDGVLDGRLSYQPPKAGRKSAAGNNLKSDIDMIWDAYAKGAATVKHAGDSLASQKSKLNAIGKWAAGKPEWDQGEVLAEALELRQKIVDQNAKAEGHKGRVKVHSVFQVMVNLAYRQTDEANAAGRIDTDTIESCVFRDAATPKTLKEEIEAMAKKAKGWYLGSGETGSANYKPPVRTDEKMGALIEALDALLTEFAVEETRAKHEAMLAELRAAGLVS